MAFSLQQWAIPGCLISQNINFSQEMEDQPLDFRGTPFLENQFKPARKHLAESSHQENAFQPAKQSLTIEKIQKNLRKSTAFRSPSLPSIRATGASLGS